MQAIHVRHAKKQDIIDITKIYEQGTRETRSYEYVDEPWDNLLENRKQWFAQHDERHPVFVAEREEKIVGWISLQPFDKRKFLQHVGEISIYVHQNYRGKGIGTRLFEKIFTFAKAHAFKKIIAVCFPDNPAIHLKKKMGFTIIGTYTAHVHRKDGTYSDLSLLEKHINI